MATFQPNGPNQHQTAPYHPNHQYSYYHHPEPQHYWPQQSGHLASHPPAVASGYPPQPPNQYPGQPGPQHGVFGNGQYHAKQSVGPHPYTGYGNLPTPSPSPAASVATPPQQFPFPNQRSGANYNNKSNARINSRRSSSSSSAHAHDGRPMTKERPAASISSSALEVKVVPNPKACERQYRNVVFPGSLNRLRIPTHGPMLDFSHYDQQSLDFENYYTVHTSDSKLDKNFKFPIQPWYPPTAIRTALPSSYEEALTDRERHEPPIQGGSISRHMRGHFLKTNMMDIRQRPEWKSRQHDSMFTLPPLLDDHVAYLTKHHPRTVRRSQTLAPTVDSTEQERVLASLGVSGSPKPCDDSFIPPPMPPSRAPRKRANPRKRGRQPDSEATDSPAKRLASAAKVVANLQSTPS